MRGLIVAWAMLPGTAKLHALVALNDGGSAVTACAGRWPTSERYSVWPVDCAPRDERCEFCERVWVDQKFVERGLRELVENTYSQIGRETRRFQLELGRFSPRDAASFEIWLGPCEHGASPIARCAAGCAPRAPEVVG